MASGVRHDELEAWLGCAIDEVHESSQGYTPAIRARLTLSDGRRVFFKGATDEETASWLRQEVATYRALEGAPFLPLLLEVIDEQGERPAMLLEDLSEAHWPPHWRPGDVEAVLERLREVASWPAPPHLPPMSEGTHGAVSGWELVRDDPEPFLSLGLCSRDWLEAALPTLLAAQARVPQDGESLVHLDVRSDNLCFHPERGVLLIDWNWAARGIAEYDVAFWLPSLRLEGGPQPWEVLPGEGALASAVSGYFCSMAGQPPLPRAPQVRPFQLEQARVALPWAVHELGLPPLDPPDSP